MRDTAIIRLFCDTGIRRAEMAGLMKEEAPDIGRTPHVDLDQQLVWVLGKGQRWRALSIGSKTALAVDRYVRERRAHPQAWRPELWLGDSGRGALTHWGIGQLIDRRCRNTGIPHIHPHQSPLDRVDPAGRLSRSVDAVRNADAGHLAALTGITETALLHALPSLAGTRDGGRPPVRAALACRRCATRAGHHGPVPVHHPAHQRACARHHAWLGRAIQIGLSGTPDIIRACQRASRLARQHGITMLVLAEATARQQAGATTCSPHANDSPAALARLSWLS